MLIPTIVWASELDGLVWVELMRASAPLPDALCQTYVPYTEVRFERR